MESLVETSTQHQILAGRVKPNIYIGLEVTGNVWKRRDWSTCLRRGRHALDLPGTLFGKILPACTYAVFTAKYGLAGLQTFMDAYDRWIPD